MTSRGNNFNDFLENQLISKMRLWRKLNNQTAIQEVNTIKAVYFTANYSWSASILKKLAYATRNLGCVQFIMRTDHMMRLSRLTEQLVQSSEQLVLTETTRCSAIAERPRCWCVNFGQKWKTGTGRQYIWTFTTNHCDVFGQQSNRIR